MDVAKAADIAQNMQESYGRTGSERDDETRQNAWVLICTRKWYGKY